MTLHKEGINLVNLLQYMHVYTSVHEHEYEHEYVDFIKKN